MKRVKKAEKFYSQLIDLFIVHKLPFMVGGTYAFSAYTNIKRPTKDVDFFCTSEEYPKLLQVCSDAGYKTELLDKNWIAKIHKEDLTADVIFAERNGLNKVTSSWFERAPTGEILGKKVKLMPPDDMLRSKAYIQVRNRYDGADVMHLILCQGKKMNWKYLYQTMEKDWALLFSYILLFIFVYPADKNIIPSWLYKTLSKQLHQQLEAATKETSVTRGLLLSPQYAVAVEKWGYKEIE